MHGSIARVEALGALLLATGIAACAASKPPPQAGPGALVFRIAPAASKPGRVGWRASYEMEGRTASFRIELEPEPRGAKLPAFVRCGLLREPGSDASLLLRDLSRALGTRAPAPGVGVEALEVEAVVLGRDLSRADSGGTVAGGFTPEPSGDWIATKLFLGDGEGEIFLNLDPVAGYGELSAKDPLYAAAVVRELGRLLQGEAVSGSVAGAAAPQAATASPATPPPTANPRAARVARLAEAAAPGVRQPERRQALEELARLGPVAKDAVPVFLEAFKDEDPLIRGEALRGFPLLRPDPRIGVAAVTPLLKDSYPLNQVRAAEALAEFGETRTAVTYLTVFLKGKASGFAAAGLTRIGPEARPAVPALIEMLEKRSSPDDGYAACRALAAIGRDASSALPALRAAEKDINKFVRDAASFAIREIDGR